MTTKLPAKLHQDICSWICAVPGVRVSGIWVDDTGQNTRIEIGIEGWSPTLHPLSMEWVIEPKKPVEEIDIHYIKEHVFSKLQKQKERAKSSLLFEEPMPMSFDIIDHVHIDRTLIDLLLNRHKDNKSKLNFKEDCAKKIRKILKDAHFYSIGNDGGIIEYKNEETDQKSVVFERQNIPAIGFSVNIKISDRINFHVFDRNICIENMTIPETLITSFIGKKLTSLMEFKNDFAESRIIEKIFNSGDDLCIYLEPEYVEIGSYLRI
jgi:hypothetical protein